ncbi:MAG TPA: PIG-L family deacetylase [Acidimicrobiales bacterium]|nr:PIG-L family deacetylase [Acidimicrobiales bacterium]
MTDRLTLMAVHAHPDDEAVATGGVLARYGDEGLRTVVVTCTNGEQGDGPGGLKPQDAGHDEAEVVRIRRAELEKACSILGVSALELLGYRDSGMDGWEANQRSDSFCNADFGQVVGRLSELMARYRPQVVVTYDENGNYGHPDHIQAHRVTVAAAEASGIPAKLYEIAFPRSAMRRFMEMAGAAGTELDRDMPDDADVSWGTPDELVGAVVDVGAYAERKRDALAAHASQTDNSMFLRLPPETFRMAFGSESFVRRFGGPPGGVVEDDLFSGLR